MTIRCPVDDTPLSLHTRSGVSFQSCPRCFGLFFSPEQFQRAVDSEEFVSPSGAGSAPVMTRDRVVCTRCGEADLQTLEEGGSRLHQCPACGSVWLSPGAVEPVLAVRRMVGRRRPKSPRERQPFVQGEPVGSVPENPSGGAVSRFFRKLFGGG
jgi:Zn-finger nucleic acid-binding protein